jgi:hypothetical protein
MIDFLFVALFQIAGGDPAVHAETAQTPAEQPAAPAQHPSDAAAPAPGAAPASTADNITVTAPRAHCHNQQSTGSHFQIRVCTTAAQDRARDAETRRFLEDARRDLITALAVH